MTKFIRVSDGLLLNANTIESISKIDGVRIKTILKDKENGQYWTTTYDDAEERNEKFEEISEVLTKVE